MLDSIADDPLLDHRKAQAVAVEPQAGLDVAHQQANVHRFFQDIHTTTSSSADLKHKEDRVLTTARLSNAKSQDDNPIEMRTIIELIAYCGSAIALTVFGDIWLTEVLYRYRLRHRSSWGLTNGFSVLDVNRLGERLVQLGRPGILGQTAKGLVLSGLQAPDVLIVDYTYLVRHYRGGATGGLSARRATTLVLAEVPGRSIAMEVQPRARRLSLR